MSQRSTGAMIAEWLREIANDLEAERLVFERGDIERDIVETGLDGGCKTFEVTGRETIIVTYRVAGSEPEKERR